MIELCLFVIGGILGNVCKLLDFYTIILGDILSELSIWILFGTLISIYSETGLQAMRRVFLFSVSMLIGYYVTADLTNAIYGIEYIKGWSIFACCTPMLAYLVWFSKKKDLYLLSYELELLLYVVVLVFYFFRLLFTIL